MGFEHYAVDISPAQFPDRDYFRSHGVSSVPLYQAYLSPRESITIDGLGGVMKFRRKDADRDSASCYMKNPNLEDVTIEARAPLDLVSIIGGERDGLHRDWDFLVAKYRVSIHCEFPKGVTKAEVHRELRQALGSHFSFAHVTPKKLKLDLLFPLNVAKR